MDTFWLQFMYYVLLGGMVLWLLIISLIIYNEWKEGRPNDWGDTPVGRRGSDDHEDIDLRERTIHRDGIE